MNVVSPRLHSTIKMLQHPSGLSFQVRSSELLTPVWGDTPFPSDSPDFKMFPPHCPVVLHHSLTLEELSSPVSVWVVTKGLKP